MGRLILIADETQPKERPDMADHENGHPVLGAQDARQGKKLGVMRYVLLFSLALAIIAGVIIFGSVKP